MGRRRRARSWDTLQINELTYEYYYNLIKSVGISTCEWHNLPPEIDERFLELTLFESGMAIFFKDDIVNLFVALTTQIGGNLDIYRVPQQRVAYSVNNYNVPLNQTNSVLIFNNKLHMPDVSVANLYAQKLRDIDMTIQINVNAQKTPLFVKTSPEQKLTMENLVMQYNGNSYMIMGDNKLNLNPIEVISTEAPYVAGDLQFLKGQILSEVFSYFGVESNPTSKQERLVRDEIGSSMGIVMANRYNRLDARNQACEIINRMFGLDLYVTYREDFRPGTAGETTDVDASIEHGGANTESQLETIDVIGGSNE